MEQFSANNPFAAELRGLPGGDQIPPTAPAQEQFSPNNPFAVGISAPAAQPGGGPQVPGAPPAPNPDEIVQRGDFLPVGRTRDPNAGIFGSGFDFALSQGMINTLHSAQKAGRGEAGGEDIVNLGLAGAGAPLVGKAAKGAIDKATSKAGIMADDLHDFGAEQFKAMTQAGVRFSNRPRDEILTRIASVPDFDQILQPRSFRIFENVLKSHPMTTLDDLHGIRTAFQRNQRDMIRSTGEAANDEARVSGEVVRIIDDVIDNMPDSDVIAGRGAEGMQALRQGKQLWRQFKKAELIDDILFKAEAQFDQLGPRQALTKGFRHLAGNREKMAMFDSAEQTAIRKASRDGLIGLPLRALGGLAPRGPISGTLGPMASGGAGLAASQGDPAFGMAGVAIGAGVGTAARAIGGGVAKRRARKAAKKVMGKADKKDLARVRRNRRPTDRPKQTVYY